MKRWMTVILFAATCMIMTAGIVLADRVGEQVGSYASGNTATVPYVNVSITVPAVPVYCFYSSFMRDHMWTASADEKEELQNSYESGKETYQLQGVSGYAEQTASEWNMPVYRFWNKRTTDHFYTTSESEKDQLEKDLASGKDHYEYEGIAWYVPKSSNTPVYRFFDTLALNHFYTSDENLKTSLSQAYLNGTGSYRYEGIAWYWY